MLYQNVKTIRSGLRCKIKVANHSDDVLTTYDPAVEGSVELASADLAEFSNACVDEFAPKTKLRPMIFGQLVESPAGTMGVIPTADDGKLYDLDLTPYKQVLIQPVPLTGG